MDFMKVTTADGRVEHQKLSQTANTLLPGGWDFGVEVDSLEKNLITLQELTFSHKQRKQDSAVGNSITWAWKKR